MVQYVTSKQVFRILIILFAFFLGFTWKFFYYQSFYRYKFHLFPQCYQIRILILAFKIDIAIHSLPIVYSYIQWFLQKKETLVFFWKYKLAFQNWDFSMTEACSWYCIKNHLCKRSAQILYSRKHQTNMLYLANSSEMARKYISFDKKIME